LLEARDGQIAIDLMRKQKPDLTLMDIKMPVLDGYTATKLIRKDAEVSDLVIVALTDATMRETEEEISQTCDGFLQNPVSKEALITELIKHLPHHIISPEIHPSNASPESALTELTGEALEKLPTLIEHLKEHQETSADLAHTQTINEVEDFAQHMQSLGEEYAYPPLVQWGEQLLLQATTFDLENMGKTLANYGRLIEEAESQLASTVSTDVENEVGSIDLELLLDTLYSDKKTWETLSQTLTINDIEDFAQRMQVLGQDHRYEPLVNWSAKLTEQASLFDMDNMAKTLGRYPEFIDAIEAQL